jgi:hypothetical protein
MRNLYWLNAAQMQWFLPYVRQSHRLLRADDRYILIHDHKCRFPRGSEPGFPSRSEPPLSYVLGVRLWSMHDCPPSSSGPLRLNWL